MGSSLGPCDTPFGSGHRAPDGPAATPSATGRPWFWCHAPPRWKDDAAVRARSVAPSDRSASGEPGRCEVSGVAARAVTGVARREGGRRAREYDTPGSEAGSGRAGRGAGRARRPHAAPRPLVAQPGGHRGVPHRLRRLRHLGRLPELALLRGGGRRTGTSSRPCTPPASPPAACRGAGGSFAHHLVDVVARAAGPHHPGRVPAHLLLLPQGLLPGLLAVTARRARWPTATAATRARPASRSSCRTCTATSSSWP